MASIMVEMTLWTPAKEVITVERNGKSSQLVLEGEQSFRFLVPKDKETEIGKFLEDVAHYRVRLNRYEFSSFESMKRALLWIVEQYQLL